MKANRDASAAEGGGAPYRLRRNSVKPTLPHKDFARKGSCVKATNHLKFRTIIIQNLVFAERFSET